jgi:hypothetical protein
MREIFPNPINRLRAYGKFAVAVYVKEPLDRLASTMEFGVFSPEEEEARRAQRIHEAISGIARWAVDGDRCNPEFRDNLLAVVEQSHEAA